MVDETVKMISICGFEGMCARVAQWWSIALPRRGSRVRIPSRALKEIEKESSDGWLFFLCSSPAGFERFECLRAAAVVAVERPPDVLRRLVLSMIQKRVSRRMTFFVCSNRKVR